MITRSKWFKRFRFCVKVAFWGYMIYTVCPDAVAQVKSGLTDIFNGSIDVVWEKIMERGHVGDRHLEGNERVREWVKGIGERGHVSNRHLDGNERFREWIENSDGFVGDRHLEGNKAVRDFLKKYLLEKESTGELDETMETMIKDLITTGKTTIR